jgi:hypothetical protein
MMIDKRLRWSAFEEEELLVLEGILGRVAGSTDHLDRVRSALLASVRSELEERKRAAGGYKGPGVYEDEEGNEHLVRGMVAVGDANAAVVQGSAEIFSVSLEEVGGWRYLRPLWDKEKR